MCFQFNDTLYKYLSIRKDKISADPQITLYTKFQVEIAKPHTSVNQKDLSSQHMRAVKNRDTDKGWLAHLASYAPLNRRVKYIVVSKPTG